MKKSICNTCKSTVSYKCVKCGQVCSTRGSFNTHFSRQHIEKPTYYCDHCNFKSKYKRYLGDHMLVKHLPKDLSLNKCEKCGKSYSGRSNFQSHVKHCGRLKQFCCAHCDYKTFNRTNFIQHFRAKHLVRDPSAYKCHKCAKCLSSKGHLSRHLKLCGQTKDFKRSLMTYSCDHCDFRAFEKAVILNHINAKHLSPDSTSRKCNKCARSYKNDACLLSHLRTCSQSGNSKRPLKRLCCYHCDYKASNKRSLSSHIQAKHLPRNPNAHKCKKCEKSYQCRSSLYAHSKICNKPKVDNCKLKNFSCEHCEYKTHTKTLISCHIQAKHLPKDPDSSKCKKCGKMYSWKSDLQRHAKICSQTEEEIRSNMRFSCEHCEYKTNLKHQFTIHVQAKHSSSVFRCKKCRKTFISLGYLNYHTRLGTCKNSSGLKRMRCDHCDYKTPKRDFLVKHLKSCLSNSENNLNVNKKLRNKKKAENVKCATCGKLLIGQKNLISHDKCSNCKNFKECFIPLVRM